MNSTPLDILQYVVLKEVSKKFFSTFFIFPNGASHIALLYFVVRALQSVCNVI